MGSGSIGNLNATITANATQFVNEFARADNASRRSAAAIDREVDKLVKGVGRKFSLADVGKDVLKGLGIGSGFAAAEQAAQAVASYWERAAESAKKIEESTARQLAATLAGIKQQQSEEQQYATMMKEADRIRRLLDTPVKNVRTFPAGEFGDITVTEQVGLTDKQKQDRADLIAQWQELDTQIKSVRDKLVDKRLTEFFGGLDARNTFKERADKFAQQAKIGLNVLDIQKKITESMAKDDEETRRLAESYADLIDPTLKYQRQIEQIDSLQRAGIPITGGYAAAIEAVKRAMNEDVDSNVENKLRRFFDDLDEQSKTNFQQIKHWSAEITSLSYGAADDMNRAWVDALEGVDGAWGNLGESIRRRIESMIAEILIVIPIMHALGAAMSAVGLTTLGSSFLTYGAGHARGGGVSAGTMYPVNEDGIEYFKPNVGGEIMPLGAQGERQNAGMTLNLTYNVASGVTRNELAPTLEAHARRIKSDISNMLLRGGSPAAAFGRR